MNYVEIAKTAITGASVILTLTMIILYFISKKAKKKEIREKAQDALKTTQSVFDLFNLVQTAVINAEVNKNFSATEKFNTAFTSIKNELFKQNKSADDEILSTMIENEIALSEKVNSDDKQKSKNTELKKIKIEE